MNAKEPDVPNKVPLMYLTLAALGWHRVTLNEGLFEVWAPLGEDSELILPLDPTKEDFKRLMDRLEWSLRQRYGKQYEEIRQSAEAKALGRLDEVLWKRETASPPGMIEWPRGTELFESARLQMVAAAKATREKRSYFGNSGSFVAKRFLQGSYMGQTSVGSYVVSAYTPSSGRYFLSKADERDGLENKQVIPAIVTGRDILTTLVKAVQGMRDAVDEFEHAAEEGVFLETVPLGGSFELAKALSEMVNSSDAAVAITLDPGTDAANRVEVEFSSAEAGVLDRAANILASEPEPQDVTIVGSVTLLSREAGDRLIRISVISGTVARKVRVHLTPEQYEIAIQAHKGEQQLQVSGRLEREGNIHWLYDPYGVQVCPTGGAHSGDKPLWP